MTAVPITRLELSGKPERIDRAIELFRERGVRVEPIVLDVIAG